MKDILIIEHLRRGDEEAFKYIYERHYVLLCRFANQISVSYTHLRAHET